VKPFALRSSLAMLLPMAFSAMFWQLTLPARADEAPSIPALSVKLGGFLPTQSNMKDAAGQSWWAFGVDYRPPFHYHPLGANIHLGADIVWHGTGNQSYNVTDVTGKLVWGITPLGSHPRVWGGLGGGLYYINTPHMAGNPTGGAKFIMGIDFTDRVFFEADYDWVGGFTDSIGTDLRVDGVTLALGVRF